MSNDDMYGKDDKEQTRKYTCERCKDTGTIEKHVPNHGYFPGPCPDCRRAEDD